MTAGIVTDETFDEIVLKSELPVLVDFFAEWCGPCKAMAPALDQVAEDLRGQVRVVKVDVDQSRTVTDTYGIRSMPTLVLFKEGKPSTIHLGALVQRTQLTEWIIGAVSTNEPAPAPRVVEFTLANGLQVVVIAKTGAAKVAHRVFYKVGSGDDPEDRAGTASLLGALLSRQTEALSGVDRPITTADVTYYFQSVTDTLKAAMVKEADRMAGLRLTDVEIASVKQQILEEIPKREDSPRSRLSWRMFEAETGGAQTDQTAQISREDLVHFHERYYAPNNAVLTVAGDVDPNVVKQLADEIYGQIPRRPEVSRRLHRARPPQTAARRFSETDTNAKQGWFNRNFVVPSFVTALPGEAEALDLLTTFLGRTGPLQRKLVKEEQLAKKASANYWAQGSGSGQISIMVTQGNGTSEKLEAAVDEILEAIRVNGVTEAELARAKEVFAAASRVENEREAALAHHYGFSVASGRSVAEVNDWPAAVAKVSAEDIKRVANAYLDPRNSVTGWIIGEPSGDADSRAA